MPGALPVLPGRGQRRPHVCIHHGCRPSLLLLPHVLVRAQCCQPLRGRAGCVHGKWGGWWSGGAQPTWGRLRRDCASCLCSSATRSVWTPAPKPPPPASQRPQLSPLPGVWGGPSAGAFSLCGAPSSLNGWGPTPPEAVHAPSTCLHWAPGNSRVWGGEGPCRLLDFRSPTQELPSPVAGVPHLGAGKGDLILQVTILD